MRMESQRRSSTKTFLFNAVCGHSLFFEQFGYVLHEGSRSAEEKAGTRESDIRSRRNSLFKRPLLPFQPASGALNVMMYRKRASEWLRRVNSC